MRKFLLLFIAVLYSFISSAQDNFLLEINKIDSLIALARQKKNEVDIESSVKYSYKVLTQSKAINYSKGKSIAYFYIADALYNMGNYQKALDYLVFSDKEEYTTESPLVLSEICRLRGRIYRSMGMYSRSIKEFNEGLEYISKIENEFQRDYAMNMAYENISIAYNRLELSDSEFYYIQKNRELLQPLDSSVFFMSWINLYGILGNYYLEKTNFDSAAYFFNQALALNRKYDFPYVSFTYFKLGNLYALKNSPDSALNCYFKALENLEVTKLKNEYPAIYREIASIYEKKEMQDKAKDYKEKELLVENELAKEKLQATEKVLQIVLQNESKKENEQYLSILYKITGSFLILLLIGFGIYVHYRNRSRKLLERKQQETNELRIKVNESFEEVLALAKQNDPTFVVRFKEVYPEFTTRLLHKHPDLLITEFSFCAMLFLNLSSKDIAQYTYVEHRSVQTRKSRLRKKLEIPAATNLYDYLRSFSQNLSD